MFFNQISGSTQSQYSLRLYTVRAYTIGWQHPGFALKPLRCFNQNDSTYAIDNLFGDELKFLELVPATKEEIAFVEQQNVDYKKLIDAFKPYLGDRLSVKEVVGLSTKQMETILESIT